MQPARDANDIRYWPRSEGGEGFRNPNDLRPSRQYSALRTYRNRTLVSDDKPTASIVTRQGVTLDYTPDTIRSRARAVLALAMTRVQAIVEDDDNELKLNELAPTIAALGRISGVQLEEQKSGDIRIHIVRDTIATPSRQLLVESTPASLLYSRDDAHVIAPSTTPTDGVTDDASTRYSDDGDA